MRVYEVQKVGSTSLEGLRQAQRPTPEPGPHEILVRIRATSLNYRDHLVVVGKYIGGVVDRETIPLSDGAGEVVAVGSGVTRFGAGDRVAGTFFQVWKDGPRSFLPPALGVPLDGVLAEYVVFQEDGAVAIPENLSFEEAAALPCAGVTAWNALMTIGNRVKPGDTVLCQGTGGVSMLALQFARAAGARVMVTSSSDEKLRRALELGASDGINYQTHADWEKEVQRITGGRGVDHIVEIGGAGSLFAFLPGAGVSEERSPLIGFLSSPVGDPNPYPLMMKGGSLHGVGVGNTKSFEEMLRAIAVNGIKPIVDKVLPLRSRRRRVPLSPHPGDFIGKLVVSV